MLSQFIFTINNNHKILRLAYYYTRSLSYSQPYKIQFMALNNYFKKNKFHISRHYQSYMLTKFRSTQKKDCALVKNFSFKNDYMTPRQSVLFSPKIYIYYTTQVFLLANKIKKYCTLEKSGPHILDFSTEHVKVFYTGIFDSTGENIKRGSSYNYSYLAFQTYRAKFSNNRVLKIDIQNFFGSITIERLFQSLKELSAPIHLSVPPEINNIINFFKASGYTTLPQSQGSLASAILSQLFLIKFTNELENISIKYHLEVVRYVDDMYIKLPKNFENRKVNKIINLISSELWKNGLNLNSKKTKLFSINSYKKEVEFSENTNYSSNISGTPFLEPPYVKDHIDWLLDNNGYKLIEFLSKVQDLYKKTGNDMHKYHKLVDKYFNVGNDNANKIQNSLIFGDKWRSLNINTQRKILTYKQIITFDPEKYVAFLLKIEKNVARLSKGHQKSIAPVSAYIQDIHSSFSHNSKWQRIYSVREGLIDSNYYIQRKKSTNILEYIPCLSKDFYQYILQFVI